MKIFLLILVIFSLLKKIRFIFNSNPKSIRASKEKFEKTLSQTDFNEEKVIGIVKLLLGIIMFFILLFTVTYYYVLSYVFVMGSTFLYTAIILASIDVFITNSVIFSFDKDIKFPSFIKRLPGILTSLGFIYLLSQVIITFFK